MMVFMILFLFFIFLDPIFANDLSGFDMNFNKIFKQNNNEQKLKENIPGFKTSNPEEVSIDTNNIKNKTTKIKDNNEVKFINDTFNKRRIYNIKEEMNLISNTKYIENNSSNIINSYNDCENEIEYKICYNINQNSSIETEKYTKICNITQKIQCAEYFTKLEDNLKIQIDPKIGSYNYENGIFRIQSNSHSNIDIVVNINIVNITGVQLTLNKVGYTHNPQLVINDKKVNFNNSDITQYFGNGDNTMRIYEGRCRTRGHISNFDFRFFLKGLVCKTLISNIKETCNSVDNMSTCNLIKTSCVDNTGVKTFYGLDIFKDCWNIQREYDCIKTKKCENDCLNMNLENCFFKSSKYLDNDKKVEQFVYKCIKENSNKTNSNAKINCLDGNCFEIEKPENNNQEFIKSMAMLMSVNETASNFDADNLQLLNGKVKKCGIKTLNFRNCCIDSGWGDFAINCNTEELQLAENNKNKQCYYIGEYCSEKEKLTGTCLEKKRSYCCYPSKLARIVNVAGKKQLNIGFGTVKKPNCDGLTMKEVQLIDFSKIDFFEIYTDIQNQITSDINFNEKVKNAVEKLYQ